MTGNAVVIIVPSNWCMNWAQPTISGTMTEKRAGDGEGEDIGTVMQEARLPRKPLCMSPLAGDHAQRSEHRQGRLLAWRRERAVEVLEVVRCQDKVIGRPIRLDVN